MKTLYQYIVETFDYGKQLFGDFDPMSGPTFHTDNYNMRFLEKAIKLYYKESEPNTEEEQRVLKAIVDRVSRYSRKNPVEFDELMFMDLLEIKNEFPRILDPSLSDDTIIYRGSYLDTQFFNDLINHNDIESAGYRTNCIHISNVDIPLRSKNKNIRIHSFSDKKGTAEFFFKPLKNNKLTPVIIGVRYGDVKDQCLFNPEFLGFINPKYEDEHELLYMGATIQPSVIYWTSKD